MPFFNGGHLWIIIALIVVLIIFGPGKLPELGGAIGRGIREFRKATSELRDEVSGTRHDQQPGSANASSTEAAPPAEPVKSQAEAPKS
jgi:TatA/E family protein of Tat protein translocase